MRRAPRAGDTIILEPVPDAPPTTVGEYHAFAWHMVRNLAQMPGVDSCEMPMALEPVNRVIAPDVDGPEQWRQFVEEHSPDPLPDGVADGLMRLKAKIYDPAFERLVAMSTNPLPAGDQDAG
jgi:hypothetical protein